MINLVFCSGGPFFLLHTGTCAHLQALGGEEIGAGHEGEVEFEEGESISQTLGHRARNRKRTGFLSMVCQHTRKWDTEQKVGWIKGF